MGDSFQQNYERELAIANLIPTRVLLSDKTESTAEDPRRCPPRFMPGKGSNFPYNIYDREWTRGAPYFQRDIADRRNWNYDFLVTRYTSEKDGKTYVVEHGPNTNVPGKFGWNTWNNRIGEKFGGGIQGSFGDNRDCGKQFLNPYTPSWYVPSTCSP
ncbi:hypothetical protein C8_60 [Cannes 8 virus]|uniref:hypothetical protein n=1 Tax=Melbournevirus TaxID=1560514 RepID=UPI000392C43F|nr:hypothetical protein MEL_052 [Melbournevirus]AGV01409.1 hypothetical protein C8_60 [Cannes 8 virus]AIT54665.1 hypothetical protein MEL_052 [Melbournevirus]